MDKSRNEPRRGFSRLDGYLNVLNRLGTQQDSSEAYGFESELVVSDADLANHYEANGLFTKIIDIPAEKAATGEFDLNISDDSVMSLVTDALEDMDWETTAAQAIKWARLFGGALAVMLIDDGGKLEDPVNRDSIQGIDELVLFERPVVEPDYYSMYYYGQIQGIEKSRSKFGKPQFFYVNSQYGSFVVHESRCLVFQNGILPETTMQAEYRYWGLPEYVRLKRALRETVTEHSNGGKLLERSVQGVYKMNGLSSMLAAEDGDDVVMRRLRTIDMARSFLNSIVVDKDGEDYTFQTFQMSGLKDVISASCNMLSAVTNIPQTILFGASPDGMNATGDSDLENWYNYLGQIQKLQLRKNLQRLLDVLFRGWLNTGKLREEPAYKLTFKPFWNLSEREQAELDKLKADTGLVRAQTAQLYCDMQVLDPSEVRKGLASTKEFNIEELLDSPEDDLLDWGLGQFPESDAPASALTSSGKDVIIKETNSIDGGPGSGRYPKGSGGSEEVDHEAAKKFVKALKGTVASNGVRLNYVSGHAAYRMKTRGIDVDTVRDILTHPDATYPGNRKHKGATCFQKNGKRIVFSPKGAIITTVDLEEDDD